MYKIEQKNVQIKNLRKIDLSKSTEKNIRINNTKQVNGTDEANGLMKCQIMHRGKHEKHEKSEDKRNCFKDEGEFTKKRKGINFLFIFYKIFNIMITCILYLTVCSVLCSTYLIKLFLLIGKTFKLMISLIFLKMYELFMSILIFIFIFFLIVLVFLYALLKLYLGVIMRNNIKILY